MLVIAPSWVGDAVMTQPLFQRLRQHHPGLALDVLAPPWTAPVFRHMPEVREVLDNPFRHGELKLAARYRLGRQLRGRGYRQAIVLPNSLKSALVPFFAGIPRRTGFVGEWRRGLLNDARPLDRAALPLMVERFAQLAEPAGTPLPRPLPRPALAVAEDERRALLDRLGLHPAGPVAVFCVGAEYGPAKRWPPEHFGRLAGMLAEAGYAVWLAGSPKDREIGEEAARQSGGAALNLCGRTDLGQALALLSAASLVVSNDSGLMHVAAALERPLIALYGSSSPGFTPPLSDRARVVSLNLSCSPCFKRECPLGHFRCMRDLAPEQVWREIEDLRPAR